MAAADARMASRRGRLREACSLLGLDAAGNDSLHRPNPWEFLISRPHRLVWCNVFKAASTSWMYNFNVLAGYSPKFLRSSKVVPLSLARVKYPRPSAEQLRAALNDSIAFLIVRHPLERLLSAYRDKLQFSLPHTLHQRLGAEIVAKYRDPSRRQHKGKGNRNPRWPTFSEFVKYLVDVHKNGEPFDMHWAPVMQFCTPCQVDFHVIIKFETLQEDQNYLIHLAGLQNTIKPEWKNPAKGRSTNKLISSYYSQLSRMQILQLYDIYRYDFELFGYTLEGYLDYGTTEATDTQNTKQ
ncbi:carbohydrate sulfotransferase 11 [Bacillus rossius redtenbacheri]|uniref:carbohydrate sulfotransferase 11 n=1 Tax=Bacillus rossius redtenbacheri TaxID=93214 RepID=UPI002FDDA9E1